MKTILYDSLIKNGTTHYLKQIIDSKEDLKIVLDKDKHVILSFTEHITPTEADGVESAKYITSIAKNKETLWSHCKENKIIYGLIEPKQVSGRLQSNHIYGFSTQAGTTKSVEIKAALFGQTPGGTLGE